MPCIYDLPRTSLERLHSVAADDGAARAVEQALNACERRSRDGSAILKRLVIEDDDRKALLSSLRRALAKEGFDGDAPDMLPIGHVYEGLILKLSRTSALAC